MRYIFYNPYGALPQLTLSLFGEGGTFVVSPGSYANYELNVPLALKSRRFE
jgi:hypothetical protein